MAWSYAWKPEVLFLRLLWMVSPISLVYRSINSKRVEWRVALRGISGILNGYLALPTFYDGVFPLNDIIY